MGVISKKLLQKLGRDFFIIDAHAHIGETVGVGVFLPEHVRVTSEDLIERMKLNGTDMAIISPLVGYPAPTALKIL
jgi:hypothetical protein